jgi:RimJ/RimL family protein N-acetyltransferase
MSHFRQLPGRRLSVLHARKWCAGLSWVILRSRVMVIATTERLILRHWQHSDRKPFSRMNTDPRVMEFMPSLLSCEESDAMIDHIESHFRELGFGLCAAELRQEHSFVGYVGLAVPRFQAIFTPCVEIGWRLSAEYWGQGLATEGAREIARHAFGILGLKDLVSFTVPGNWRSRRVMEKLGMTHDPADDFDHPNWPQEHPLSRHVLYRLRHTEFESAHQTGNVR